jgi:hypothetical protein
MNRSFLTGFLLSFALSLIALQLYACPTDPTAKIVSPYAQYTCIGGTVSFDGKGSGTAVPPTGSYDGDNGDPQGGGNGINIYYWNYSDDSTWHQDGGTPDHTFNTAGYSYVYLYVRDNEGVLSSYTSCYVCVIRAESVTQDKTSACINETVTFTATTYPLYKTLGCAEWEKSYRENITDSWGSWTAVSGGGNTAILNTDTPGYYKYRVRNGSSDSWKESSEVTVIRAKIISTPEYVLVYTGDHSGSQPTRLAIASGEPKGGTFSWSYEQSGSGAIEFVDFTDDDSLPFSVQIAEIRGTAESSIWGDVLLKVKYTLSGKECEYAGTYLNVRRPNITSAIGGECHVEEGIKHYRNYYHVVYCQFGYFLEDTGIPFDEVVTPGGSDTGVTSTQYYGPDNYDDGEWYGGVAARDTLSCPAGAQNDAEFHQQLLGGGWLTTPEFDIYFQPSEAPYDPWPSIWKTEVP